MIKPLIYFESADKIKRSGIGRAMRHQITALRQNGVEACIDKNDANYNIAHINTYFPKSQRLLRKCQEKGIPVIVHGHSTYEDFRDSFRAWRQIEPFYDASLKYMYSRAEYIIAPTKYAKELIESYSFVKCPVTAISNGIDIKEYEESSKAKEAFRSLFEIRKEEPFVMGVGFPFARKGLQDFIAVARRFPNVKFIWFGGLQRILTSSFILKEIKRKPENVIMPGYCSGEVIRGAYQCASAMLFPSYEETEGIVVLEALASRCPLVCRDIGVYEGWLFDGDNSHLCKDNEGFEKELSMLISHGESQSVLDAGYRTAMDRNLKDIGQKLIETYKKVLSNQNV